MGGRGRLSGTVTVRLARVVKVQSIRLVNVYQWRRRGHHRLDDRARRQCASNRGHGWLAALDVEHDAVVVVRPGVLQRDGCARGLSLAHIRVVGRDELSRPRPNYGQHGVGDPLS